MPKTNRILRERWSPVDELVALGCEYPGLRPTSLVDVRLGLWHLPAFEHEVVHLVFGGRSETRLKGDLERVLGKRDQTVWVRRVVRHHGDPGLSKPTFACEAVLPPESWDELVVDLSELRVPLPIDVPTVGLDGRFTGLMIGGLIPAVMVQWWCDAPAQWLPLAAVHRKWTERFDGLLPEYSPART